VAQLHQEHDLSVRSLRISRIIKSIKVLFKSFDFLRSFVSDLPNVPIGSTPDFLVDLKPTKNVTLYLLAHEK